MNIKNKSFGQRLHDAIPGGAHTYSRGDDQFPKNAPDILVRGLGSTVWDSDNISYLDYGMGLRSVSLGYACEEVNSAAIAAIEQGNSLTRASLIELQAAEKLIELVDSVDMVKFTKNGSTATSAAIKLARAFTDRKIVARCSDHPFFSYDDWFIGSTPITRGIPSETISQTKQFKYNDINSLENLISEYPNEIACVILEPAGVECPKVDNSLGGCCRKAVCDRFSNKAISNYLKQVESLCKKNGIVFILDETITGFRWSLKGAQDIFGVSPDLTTFGKAMANGFSVAAVGGKREIMELGSISKQNQERLFLLSTTHGAEMSGLGAFLATQQFIIDHNVVDYLWDFGANFKKMFEAEVYRAGLQGRIKLVGPAISPNYMTQDKDGLPDFSLRTLFAQELIKQNILMPWISFSYSHTKVDLEKTRLALANTLSVCGQAVEKGYDGLLDGETIKPVFRKFN
jgi:glutamate-1-semialdehyde 2,1-aminomutase